MLIAPCSAALGPAACGMVGRPGASGRNSAISNVNGPMSGMHSGRDDISQLTLYPSA